MAASAVFINAGIIPAADPLWVEWATWLAIAGTGVGEWLVVALWAIVSLVVLALGFVATRLLPRLKASPQTN